MLLERLAIENYGVYGGRAEVDLTATPDRPIVLVGGLNGAGKTTMFESIMVALYGRAYLGPRATGAQYRAFISDKIHRGRGGKKARRASVEVGLRLRHNGSEDSYMVARSWDVEGASVSESLEVRRNGEPMDGLDGPVRQQFVDGLLPIGLARLFFFDGEKIVRATEWDGGKNEELGASLDALLGTDLVNRLSSDLDLYVMRRTGGGAEGGAMQARYDALEAEMRDVASEIESLKSELGRKGGELEAALTRISSKEAGIAGAGGGYADMRGELLAKKAATEERMRGQMRVISEALSGDAPLCLAGPLLEGMARQVDSDVDAVRRRSAAAMVRDGAEALKREIMSEGFWPGGRPEAAERICERLDEMAREPEEGAFFDMSPDDAEWLRRKIGDAVEGPGGLVGLLEEHGEAGRHLERVDADLARIPRDDELGPKITEINGMHQEAGMLKAEMAGIEQSIATKEAHRRVLQSRLKGALDAMHKSGASDRGVEMASRVKEALAEYHGSIRERKMRDLEEHLLGTARALLHKEFISRIEVDRETLEVRVYGGDPGEPIPGGLLSMGERQMVGTALLWAIARACGRPLPFVIDTPLGRLDGAHLDNLVEKFYPYVSHQLVLLSTDREIGPKEYARLSGHVSRSYRISYDPEAASTTVSPGYLEEAEAVAQA